MNVATLNQKIELLRNTDQKDSYGAVVQDWAVVARPWANVRFVSGLETVKADRESQRTAASIRIRFRSEIDSSFRVRYKGRDFEITGVLPTDDRRFLDLACVEWK